MRGLAKKRKQEIQGCMSRYEDVGVLLKETGQCVKGEWEREGGRGRRRGGLLFTVCPGLESFLKPSSGARVSFVC